MAYSYDELQGQPQDPRNHPDTRLAGDIVPLKIPGILDTNNNNWQNAGPSAPDQKTQALKILNAPSTNNVIGIGNKKVIK